MSNQRTVDSIRSDLVFLRHSAGMPCPYLPGRVERQLYSEMTASAAAGQTREDFRRLSQAGFRRSHNIVYRPACPGCTACVPVRVVARDFAWTTAWRRTMQANRDLAAADTGLTVTDEQYSLFRRYILSRHGAGEMAAMTRRDYAAMVASSPVDTGLVEFRDAAGTLVATCLTDRLDDGLSAVYSFFDPGLARRSLGTFMVLWLIAEANRRGLPYVYLGFWIEGSRKMAYKSRFRPLEGLDSRGWIPLGI